MEIVSLLGVNYNQSFFPPNLHVLSGGGHQAFNWTEVPSSGRVFHVWVLGLPHQQAFLKADLRRCQMEGSKEQGPWEAILVEL